jgi:hypothetical protein
MTTSLPSANVSSPSVLPSWTRVWISASDWLEVALPVVMLLMNDRSILIASIGKRRRWASVLYVPKSSIALCTPRRMSCVRRLPVVSVSPVKVVSVISSVSALGSSPPSSGRRRSEFTPQHMTVLVGSWLRATWGVRAPRPGAKNNPRPGCWTIVERRPRGRNASTAG